MLEVVVEIPRHQTMTMTATTMMMEVARDQNASVLIVQLSAVWPVDPLNW
jgi:hypothetical protein